MERRIKSVLVSALVVACWIAGAGWSTSAANAQQVEFASRSEHVPGAHELEGRLIAPCCWTQTLDIHDSPIADELRSEIRRRLSAGELAGVIEDDLAVRYGEKIRAVPRGSDPRTAIPSILAFGMLATALMLVWAGFRWVKRNAEPAADSVALTSGPGDSTDSKYDDQLDAELRAPD
jgi:cytochrome c-type biogenesis protein CcmH